MAKLRKFSCYRSIERPYTRKSKYKNKGYIKAVPSPNISRYNMGDSKRKFSHQVDLISTVDLQVRSNAIESARQVGNRRLEVNLGNNYYFIVRTFPHHALRENKMLVGAGADRMQTGMQRSFGSVIGVAAQVRKNQPIFSVYVDKNGLETAKEALKIANTRLPRRFNIIIKEIKA